MNKTKVLGVFLVASLLLNASLVYLHLNHSHGVGDTKEYKELVEKYPYLSKRILLDSPRDLLINFLSLRKQLTKKTEPWGEDFGLYFEYLPTGTSIGINSTNEFYAASLFKLPVTIAYYHSLEAKKLKSEELVIQEEDLNSDFGDLWKKGVGTKINSEEAVKLALIKSDNTAAKLIARRVNNSDFEKVYQSLDLDLKTGTGGAVVTVRNYSTVLKSLYFSSVINKDDSNKMLGYLNESKFNDKLIAGVPTDVPVAHKIGDFNDKNGNEGYRDCGIVYLPRRPYLLCMYSIGSEGEANQRMKDVSKIVFDYVSKLD